jgi:outer membrane protein assembly factor BamD (BamD/ComL family)
MRLKVSPIMNKYSTLLCVLICLVTLSLSACSGQKAEELYKTAQFEELQTNWEHAGQLYERIIADYPKSEHADKAKARLSALADENKYPAGD